MRGSGVLSPKAGLGLWAHPEPPRLLVAFALAALTPSPGAEPTRALGKHPDAGTGTRTRFPSSHPKTARLRWEQELIPPQGEATPGTLCNARAPGAPPAVCAGEQRLCATTERSRRQNPTRRRTRSLHQPKASGGAKPFAAAREPPDLTVPRP